MAIIVAFAIAVIALYVGALMLPSAASPAQPGSDVPSVRSVADCKTIGAKRHNRWLKVRRQITGNDQRFKSRPVCVNTHRDLLESVRKARRACTRNAITTGATWYGGAGDSMTSGTSGAYGDLSNHPWSFAELGMGKAMGGLAPLSWWYVRGPNGKVKRAQKRDIGGGGGPVGGYTRGFDAWHPLAQYLGLMGNGVVKLHKRNCWAK